MTNYTHTPVNLILAFVLQAAGRPGLFYALQFVLVIAIMYFLLIMPQRKERKRHAEMLSALKPGDDVVTMGGLMGEVISIKDESVMIKSGDSRVMVERSRIARRGTTSAT